MIKFIKKELELEESLKQRIMIICDFCNTTPTIRNDSIRKIGIEEEPSKFRYTIFEGIFTEKLGIDLLIMCEIMFGKILKKFISYLSWDNSYKNFSNFVIWNRQAFENHYSPAKFYDKMKKFCWKKNNIVLSLK